MIQKYRTFFKEVQPWALGTALISFGLYLLLFLGICYGFTWMPDDNTFQKKFERYFLLAIGIYTVVPFALSCALVYFTLNIDNCCILLWLKLFVAASSLYVVSTLSAGIYITVEGTLYVGITLIISIVLLGIIKLHTVLIVAALYQEREEANSSDSDSVSTQDS